MWTSDKGNYLASSLAFRGGVRPFTLCFLKRDRLARAGAPHVSTVSLDPLAKGSPPAAPAAAVASVMGLPTFLRLFQLRESQIMWFLGAGASRACLPHRHWHRGYFPPG